jgi:ATP-dependent RNA helicase DeaD
MGFIDEIRSFLSELPKERQSLYFSATMPPKIKSLIETFSVNPVVVQVKSQEISANVEQEAVRTTKDAKFGKLKEILSGPGADRVLIFSETKRDVEKLSNDLVSHGFKADSIHGDKRQAQRQRALNNFKEDRVDILVATDVAARGLDIKDVTHVINYTVPQSYDDYVHRIGRTGRANSLGKALTFVE